MENRELVEKIYQYRCLLCREEFKGDNMEIIIDLIQEHYQSFHRLPDVVLAENFKKSRYDCQLECIHCDFAIKTSQIYDIDDYINHNCEKMDSIRDIHDQLQEEFDFKDDHAPKYYLEG